MKDLTKNKSLRGVQERLQRVWERWQDAESHDPKMADIYRKKFEDLEQFEKHLLEETRHE